MGLEVLRGRISHYRAERHFADFVFTDQDRKGMGVLAVTAGLAGLSGQAVGMASAAGSTKEEADYLQFEIDGKPVKGWVWRSPFQEGDRVEVAAEWQADHYELYAIARPADNTIALYPHCSRGSKSHWRNAWWSWLWGTGIFIFFGMLFVGVIGLFVGESHAEGLYGKVLFAALAGSVSFFYPFFALMTWSLGRKWMPFVRLSERVFTALGWDNPAEVDLVKRSKAQRRGGEALEYGVFYFRY
ncbi:putative type VI secretion system effector [Pseudothauera lacus]|uniref:Uncharacterized protein n=1 Tax=Pseudothauera lacus TaxID=2136175 RepID=A0A2T4IAZ7_9RHOO|nr:putative type VI secretion system effector [Pseudothauera lacus]PTD94950.1 hypothetical protein C8261_16915 [Pseudothauera lacus]